MKHEKGFRRVAIALSVVVFVVMLLPVWSVDYVTVVPGTFQGGGWATRTMHTVPLALLIAAFFMPWYWGWYDWGYVALGAMCLVISGLFALIPWAGFYGIRWVVAGFSEEDGEGEKGSTEGQG